MKRFIAVALAAVLSALTIGSPAPAAERLMFAVMYAGYDLDSATGIHGRSVGEGGSVWAEKGYLAPHFVETVSAATTITGVTGSDDAFILVDAGDLLQVIEPGAPGIVQDLAVVTNADNDTVTVDRNVNLDVDGGVRFRYRKVTFDATASDVKIPTKAFDRVQFHVAVSQMNATSITADLECYHEGPFSTANPVGQRVFTDVGAEDFVIEGADFDWCQVKLTIDTDDGSDTGADAEQVSLFVVGVK